MTYRVDLDIYNGPMDLLLYLIRKEEVDIQDIPIGRITEQYLAYLDFLESMDINVAGDFLVMAATLMEIKSRMLLPRPEVAAEDGLPEPEEDPRLELIRQLLAYKRFRDAADELQTLGDEQWRRFSRPAAEIVIGPEDQRYAIDEMMKDVQLWDLLNAFAKVLRSISLVPREVVYDDTPIEDIAERLLALLSDRKSALFTDLLTQLFAGFDRLSRAHVIGAFLATLECIRQRLIGVEQDKPSGELRVFLREDRPDVTEMKKVAPPETYITSRDAARQVDGFDRPHGRFSDELEEFQATEFDKELESIAVPEVEKPKPLLTDDELLGRAPPAAGETTESPATEDAPAPDIPTAPGEQAAETPTAVPQHPASAATPPPQNAPADATSQETVAEEPDDSEGSPDTSKPV